MLAVQVSLLVDHKPMAMLPDNEWRQFPVGVDFPDDVAPLIGEVDPALPVNHDARAGICPHSSFDLVSVLRDPGVGAQLGDGLPLKPQELGLADKVFGKQ